MSGYFVSIYGLEKKNQYLSHIEMTTTTHDILQQLEMQLKDTITINASRRHKSNLRLYLWMNGYMYKK